MLNERELQVLELIGREMSRTVIALALDIKLRQVDEVRRSISKKLGLSGRKLTVAAALLVYRLEQLDDRTQNDPAWNLVVNTVKNNTWGPHWTRNKP